MHLRKYHGLGNDFLILLDRDGTQPVDGRVARAVCDRHRGVGADGLIRVTADPLTMELYNADGSRAETSGNGLRCVARAVVDGGMADGPELRVHTDAGPRRLVLHDDGTVSAEMGAAARAEHAAVYGHANGRAPRHLAVNVGNPHLVVEAADPDALFGDAAAQYAVPSLNVELVWFGPGADEATMRVWERGVGETQACGSGACAVAWAGREWGLVGDTVTVHQPGGAVTVALGDPITLTGPAEFVFEVDLAWP